MLFLVCGEMFGIWNMLNGVLSLVLLFSLSFMSLCVCLFLIGFVW